jgi:hypothetical protein
LDTKVGIKRPSRPEAPFIIHLIRIIVLARAAAGAALHRGPGISSLIFIHIFVLFSVITLPKIAPTTHSTT